jgi:hypothetical protein
VPVLVIHGSADRNLPIDGGVGAKAFAVHEVRSVDSAVDFWRRHDGCAESARLAVGGVVRRTSYASCSGGSEVELVTIEGGGHSWSGGDRLARFLDAPSPAFDASSEIWRFFARHCRPLAGVGEVRRSCSLANARVRDRAAAQAGPGQAWPLASRRTRQNARRQRWRSRSRQPARTALCSPRCAAPADDSSTARRSDSNSDAEQVVAGTSPKRSIQSERLMRAMELRIERRSPEAGIRPTSAADPPLTGWD